MRVHNDTEALGPRVVLAEDNINQGKLEVHCIDSVTGR